VLIDDPIAMDAFYLDMRLSNDPDMGKHAEDYNLMVTDMVKGSQQRGGANASSQSFPVSYSNPPMAPPSQL
jgi:hypothetical protein